MSSLPGLRAGAWAAEQRRQRSNLAVGKVLEGREAIAMGDGLSRRDMIKGAAIAGAAAWTAPVILSSLTDAAGADPVPCEGTNCAAFKIASNASINQPNLCPDCGLNSQISTLGTCIT